MWLLAGRKAPDHCTITRFRTGFLAEACEDLLYQLVRRFAAMEEMYKSTWKRMPVCIKGVHSETAEIV